MLQYGCNATDTLEYKEQLYKRYNKPVWLTGAAAAAAVDGRFSHYRGAEFNCGATANSGSNLALMKDALALFDASDAVEGYAWFGARTNQAEGALQAHATLMEGTGESRLTALDSRYLSI